MFSKKNAGNDFMAAMKSTQKNANTNLKTKNINIENLFQKAINNLTKFEKDQNPEYLKRTWKIFLKLIEQKPSNVENYVYMAYILFLFDQNDDAINYIKIAEGIDSNYKHLKSVKNCILN